jgi:hypothetical protein
MARKKVADLLVDVLAEAGVQRIYGLSLPWNSVPMGPTRKRPANLL